MASSSSINITEGLPDDACEYASENASRKTFSLSPACALWTEYGLQPPIQTKASRKPSKYTHQWPLSIQNTSNSNIVLIQYLIIVIWAPLSRTTACTRLVCKSHIWIWLVRKSLIKIKTLFPKMAPNLEAKQELTTFILLVMNWF